MADGTTKAIEQVKVGDLVISRDEKSGEVAAKKVTHTSIREHILTLKLTFADGSVLETTSEHPLYAEGKGFVKAKEVGIGTSIVTRAGPSLKIVGVERDVRSATVYNFTVEDFHTYFVGDAALWVHNAPCPQAVAEKVDPSLNHIDDVFAKHMYEGETVNDPQSVYNGEWSASSGGGAHTWDAIAGRVVKTKYSTNEDPANIIAVQPQFDRYNRIYDITKVEENAATGVRQVYGYRMGEKIRANGARSGEAATNWQKTIWPKGMSQQDINAAAEQAYIDAISAGGKIYPSVFQAFKNGNRFEAEIIINGHSVRLEGYTALRTNGVELPINVYSKGNSISSWIELQKPQW